MPRLPVTDLFRLDAMLSDDERAIRDAVARMVETDILPHVGRWFRDAVFPRELVPRLGELGVLGGTVKGHGCPGLSTVAYGLVLKELERGDSGLRSFASVQGSLVMFPIDRYGTDAHRERWLPAMARGEAIGCFGLTEPDAGSDPAAMRSRARRVGDGFVLTGTKAWITSGTIADVAVVWAKVDDGDERSIRGFLVELDRPGVSAREIPGKHSLRASHTAELSFQEVELPRDAMLPGVEGLKGPLSCLHKARAGIGFAVMGAAEACFEAAAEYAAGRTTFGRPIAGYQLTQEKLVAMLESIVTGNLLGLRLLRLADEGPVSPEQVSLVKRHNVKAALEVAREARSILGANGVTDAYPPVRHMLNLESVYTYEGTHEVHTLVVGKAITGLSAFGD